MILGGGVVRVDDIIKLLPFFSCVMDGCGC